MIEVSDCKVVMKKACVSGVRGWKRGMLKQCVFLCKQQKAPSAPRAFFTHQCNNMNTPCAAAPLAQGALRLFASAKMCSAVFNLGFLESFFHGNVYRDSCLWQKMFLMLCVRLNNGADCVVIKVVIIRGQITNNNTNQFRLLTDSHHRHYNHTEVTIQNDSDLKPGDACKNMSNIAFDLNCCNSLDFFHFISFQSFPYHLHLTFQSSFFTRCFIIIFIMQFNFRVHQVRI